MLRFLLWFMRHYVVILFWSAVSLPFYGLFLWLNPTMAAALWVWTALGSVVFVSLSYFTYMYIRHESMSIHRYNPRDHGFVNFVISVARMFFGIFLVGSIMVVMNWIPGETVDSGIEMVKFNLAYLVPEKQ